MVVFKATKMAAGQIRWLSSSWTRKTLHFGARNSSSFLWKRPGIFTSRAGLSKQASVVLTEAQKQQYENEGYLVVKDVFDKNHIQKLKDALDECEERARSMTESTETMILDAHHSPDNPTLQRIFLPSLLFDVFEDIHYHERLLDIVSELIGPNIRFLRQDKLNFKQPRGTRFPVKWHQDWAFYPYTNKNVVVPCIAIDDCTQENGCLQVIPKSNNGPLYSHFTDGEFSAAINDARLDSSTAVYLEVPSGGMSLHNIFTVHGSAPNKTNHKRRMLILHYCATDAWPLVGVVSNTIGAVGPVDWDLFTSTVVRGKATPFPRMEALPVCIPIPFENNYVIESGDHGYLKSSHEDPK